MAPPEVAGSVGTVGAAIRDATRRLTDAGSPSARLDAEVLLGHVTGRERSWLLAHPEAPVESPGSFEAAVLRRAGGEPVAYIRGFKDWHSLRIRTDPRALIPRPETELLADATVAEIEVRLARAEGPIAAWEVATGSGAVAVVLARRFGHAIGSGRLGLSATDVSPEALALAAENLADHGVADFVTLALADLLAPAGDAFPRPDVVVANLPYVASAEVVARRGSLGHEPRVALDGGPDGLDLLRRLLEQAAGCVAPGATLLLELGVGQVEVVTTLAPTSASVSVVPDLAGLDRVVRIEMPD